MINEEAEHRVVTAATRDAELHQCQHPGELLEERWARERWSLIVNEPELLDGALLLGGAGFALYLDTLDRAVRINSKLVQIRIEHWLDLVLEQPQRRPQTIAEVLELNNGLKRASGETVLLNAGGAEIVSKYTQHWCRRT
jgi:hypothetical protein